MDGEAAYVEIAGAAYVEIAGAVEYVSTVGAIIPAFATATVMARMMN